MISQYENYVFDESKFDKHRSSVYYEKAWICINRIPILDNNISIQRDNRR